MEISRKIAAYYKEYYHKDLGIPDWEARIQRRINEEETFGDPVIRLLQKCANVDFAGKKILIVGAGTGAELFALHAKGAEMYGLEPSGKAIEILNDKAAQNGLAAGRILQGFAESIPLATGFFDLVYCYTVLEHVQDVNKALDEMLRVCRVGGKIFLEYPNYAVPYEPHYKMMMPTFLPKSIMKSYLRFRGRPDAFLDSINFINTRKLLDRFRYNSATCMRIYPPFPDEFKTQKHPLALVRKFFGIEKDVYLLIHKDRETDPEAKARE